MTKFELQAAQAELKTHLEGLFGPKLHGISGFGAGLDHVTLEPSLKVMTTNHKAKSLAEAQLPAEINGVTVQVFERGPALFE